MNKQPRDYPFLVRLTAEEKEGLEKYANEYDLSQSQVVRKSIKELISK